MSETAHKEKQHRIYHTTCHEWQWQVRNQEIVLFISSAEYGPLLPAFMDPCYLELVWNAKWYEVQKYV